MNVNNKLIFLGFAISHETMNDIGKQDRFPQFAAHKLQWNIIRGIEEASGQSMDIVSAVPVSNYPGYPAIFFGLKKWMHKSGSTDFYIPFINIMILKHITRFISSLVLASLHLIRHRKIINKQILIYAMHSPFMLSALLATRLFGGRVFLIIPDMPAFMDLGMRRGMLRRIAKKIDAFFMSALLSKMSGLIVLTKHVAEDMTSGTVPYLVMEGAVSLAQDVEDNVIVESDYKIIMYTGSLVGLELLLMAFSRVDDSSYRLWISGRGEMEAEIRTASQHDGRIIYWGILSETELMEKKQQATVLVNARSSQTPFIQYSFPSKLLEYMVSGRPVVSTELPSIPDEYHPYLYIVKDESVEGMASYLKEVCSKSPQELAEFGNRARNFVVENKNYIRQGERIYSFLQNC